MKRITLTRASQFSLVRTEYAAPGLIFFPFFSCLKFLAPKHLFRQLPLIFSPQIPSLHTFPKWAVDFIVAYALQDSIFDSHTRMIQPIPNHYHYYYDYYSMIKYLRAKNQLHKSQEIKEFVQVTE